MTFSDIIFQTVASGFYCGLVSISATSSKNYY